MKKNMLKIFCLVFLFFLIYKYLSVDPKNETKAFSYTKAIIPIDLYVYLLKKGQTELFNEQGDSLLSSSLNTPLACLKVKMLLQSGAYPDQVEKKGNSTPVMIAVGWLDVCSTEALVKSGANIGLKDKNGLSVFDYVGKGNSSAEEKIASILISNITKTEIK